MVWLGMQKPKNSTISTLPKVQSINLIMTKIQKPFPIAKYYLLWQNIISKVWQTDKQSTLLPNGNLWVVLFQGYKVIKIDGKNPETLLDEIKLPGKLITSVVFGEVNLDELYVTSASFPFFDGIAVPEEDNGVLYRITNIGAKGLDGVRAKLQ